jgi:hypothetical protein
MEKIPRKKTKGKVDEIERRKKRKEGKKLAEVYDALDRPFSKKKVLPLP